MFLFIKHYLSSKLLLETRLKTWYTKSQCNLTPLQIGFAKQSIWPRLALYFNGFWSIDMLQPSLLHLARLVIVFFRVHLDMATLPQCCSIKNDLQPRKCFLQANFFFFFFFFYETCTSFRLQFTLSLPPPPRPSISSCLDSLTHRRSFRKAASLHLLAMAMPLYDCTNELWLIVQWIVIAVFCCAA